MSGSSTVPETSHPLSTGFPYTPAFALNRFGKKKNEIFTLDALTPPKPCLLLPSSPLQWYTEICVGTGYASQNAACKSLLYLKGIVNFSASTFYQLHALSTE